MFLVGMVAYERDVRAVATKDRRGRGLKMAVLKDEAIVAASGGGANRLEGARWRQMSAHRKGSMLSVLGSSRANLAE